MSFFNFDQSRHNTAAPGFSQAHDPFASLANREEEAEEIDFEDTYDGLGDQLDETDDVFNDDTFGGDTGEPGPVGKDFDFFGQTAKVANAIEEENVRFSRQQPAARAPQPVAQPSAYTSTAGPSIAGPSYNYFAQAPARPARTGYEKYHEQPIEDLQVDAALWGVAPKKQPPPPAQPAVPSAPPGGRKMLSLEEVEAQMRAQAKAATPSPAPQHQPHQMPHEQAYLYQQQAQNQPQAHFQAGIVEPLYHQPQGHPMTILQRPHSKPATPAQPSSQPPAIQQHQQPVAPQQPTQILQNPNRLSGDAAKIGLPVHPTPPSGPQSAHQGHRQQGSLPRQPTMILHPAQLAQLSEEEKAAYLEQEAKRAKRNHKIFQMSRDNGIMTPQDKNFITRIQLQQLVAATGNPNEHGTDESLAEDFYYQVHSQIQAGHRQHPSQPLNQFAQTYLFQTGSRQGGMRRHNRGPENHMQRMEQQVQRAVEAAKNKPKNKQLVIEGSLGKISFSNAKTPKPLLNIKRNDSAGDVKKAPHPVNGRDKKDELRALELVYTTLMKMEDHERNMPMAPAEDDQEALAKVFAWSSEGQALNEQLWKALRVQDQDQPGRIHPFMALLCYNKGKKAIPRIFRHTNHEQRITIFTRIVVNLDQLDVVREAQVTTDDIQFNAAMRENIELFSAAIVTTLFTFMNELGLDLVAAILGLVCTRNVDVIAKSRIGASMLTMILSRAELIKHNGGGSEQDWRSWDMTYTQFFNLLEPTLPYIFPGSIATDQDTYVWQLLAAIGIGASPDQQQRLVIAVKDRVMDTVSLAKTLPPALAGERLQNVNLFMRSIGLDVELLQ
ncbi:topoisomerase II-associated protein PAT1 [Neurospora tetraspora]|uniref:Topoisomerase II-associated protein PAT1 n=1 Tax=Neurospora tetraspora TaxID=94610 RepID=A0AAE0JA23_9PEZI|nr:topoisomerase II-associated protein PAT1 [Neurospora tetraspora]